MHEQIADLALFETHLTELFEALPTATAPGDWTSIFNMQPFLERFTMDTATEFLFGESVHSQKEESADMDALVSKKEMMQFVEAFFAAEKTTAASMIYGDLFFLKHDRKFKQQCKTVHDFVDTYVQRRLRTGNSEKKSGAGRYVVLDAIVADFKDPHELRCQLLNILLAGSDTTSGTLGFVMATLAQYPHIFKKLRNTVIGEFGSFDRPKQITLSKLKNCSYLQWFLNEILRVYPVVPVNFRESVKDTTLPTGGGPDGTSPVFIPKGYFVAWEVSHCLLSSHCLMLIAISPVLISVLYSFGRSTPIQNSGALMLIALIQNDGKGENSGSTTFHSTPDLEYVSDNNLLSLRLPMPRSDFCRSSTQLMDQRYRRDGCRVTGNWSIKWPEGLI